MYHLATFNIHCITGIAGNAALFAADRRAQGKTLYNFQSFLRISNMQKIKNITH
jgi:hypothetical protein